MAYALVALILAVQNSPNVALLRTLVFANWVWSVISVLLLAFYISAATTFGAIFLVLQVIVVGALAYVEGRYIFPANTVDQ
jgi:hypothetical protein